MGELYLGLIQLMGELYSSYTQLMGEPYRSGYPQFPFRLARP